MMKINEELGGKEGIIEKSVENTKCLLYISNLQWEGSKEPKINTSNEKFLGEMK